MILPRKLGAALVGTALGLGALSGVAVAQTSTTTAAKPARPTDAQRQAMKDERLAELAGRLGVTKEKLQQALKDQRKADVDKAVTAGRLTAAQATELKAAIDKGDVHLGLGRGGFGHGHLDGPIGGPHGGRGRGPGAKGMRG